MGRTPQSVRLKCWQKSASVWNTNSDVYVVFDSAQVKSADPVTYDNDGNVIPLSERFNDSEQDIRYKGRDSRYDFSLTKDLDTLDDKALKVYNKRGWAYSLFNDEDMVLLREKLDEYAQLKTRNSDNILPDGSMVTDINNKMLLIGGTRNSPVIHAVLLINASAEEYAEMIKDDIYDDTKEFGIHARQCTNYLSNCENWYGNGTVKFYGSEDYYHIKGREQERAKTPDGFEDFGYVKDYEIGRRLREEAERTGNVKFQSREDARYNNDWFDENQFQDFEISDWEYDDTTADTIAREYVSHHEDIGEVFKNRITSGARRKACALNNGGKNSYRLLTIPPFFGITVVNKR